MKKILVIGIGIIILAAIITGCTRTLESPQIELSTASFDMGDINPDDGIRTETFFIRNNGNSLLKIISVSTSCGCTEAEVESEEIPSGEVTKLIVKYDPSVHPGLVGKIKRIIYIQSNDPLNAELELELVGNALASSTGHDDESKEHESEEEHEEEYEGLLKEFEISPPAFYDKIKAKKSIKILDVREDFEYEENHIEDTLLLSVNEISQVELDKLGLKKDDEIIVYCRSGKRSAKAFQILDSLGYTNVKSLYGGIVHWIEDEYPTEQGSSTSTTPITATNSDGTAQISFDKSEFDFGEITKFGGIIKTNFLVSNTGDADLTITSVSTSCGCATAELEETVIAPGAVSTLTVTFDPNFHEEPAGRFSRTVFLETNDPNNPEAEVQIWMDILEGQ